MRDRSRRWLRPDAGEVHALVLAGGRGTRLRHITEALGEPPEKQFCRLGGERSLLQQTIERLVPLAPPRRTTVVVRRDHQPLAASQLEPYRGVEIVAQPADRGTGVGVLAGLVASLRNAADGVTILAPADHAFLDEEVLRDVLRDAICAARRERQVVLVGAEADAPRSDYGWIVPDGDDELPGVSRFVEKPPVAEARALLRQGGLFNTMILVAPTRELLHLFAKAAPLTLRRLLPAMALTGWERSTFFADCFEELGPLDFSRDILGMAGGLRVAVLPREAQWTDLGDEARLVEWLEQRGSQEMLERLRSLCLPESGVRPIAKTVTKRPAVASGSAA